MWLLSWPALVNEWRNEDTHPNYPATTANISVTYRQNLKKRKKNSIFIISYLHSCFLRDQNHNPRATVFVPSSGRMAKDSPTQRCQFDRVAVFLFFWRIVGFILIQVWIRHQYFYSAIIKNVWPPCGGQRCETWTILTIRSREDKTTQFSKNFSNFIPCWLNRNKVYSVFSFPNLDKLPKNLLFFKKKKSSITIKLDRKMIKINVCKVEKLLLNLLSATYWWDRVSAA